MQLKIKIVVKTFFKSAANTFLSVIFVGMLKAAQIF